MKVSSELLKQVQIDNIREHKIGESGGMSWEVAEELGFMATDKVVELIQDLNTQVEPTTVRKPTIAEMNANERRHFAEARQDRRNSAF